jgi:Nif-specific regulatory protein
MQSGSRANSALVGMYEISKVLTRPARLEVALSGVINLLASFLDMNNGLIALLDEQGHTSTVVGAGWSEATAKEHFDRLPEQAVGQIVVSGMPLIVRNIAESPLFADWSELKTGQAPMQTSFVGVPIKGETRTIGTIMIERLDGNSSPHTLDEDARFLTMVASLVAQAVALKTMMARDRERLMSERHRLEKELEQRTETGHAGIDWIIGESAAIREVIGKIQQVARVNLPVLLCGESGTGKELFARAIHEYSPRNQKPYIRLNCAALSETVLESELFGHERGSFTGAVGLRKGRFELADGGTLFLDEIGEISGAFRPSCCASCRKASLSAWAATTPSRWMCAWWLPRTAIWKLRCSQVSSALTFTIASAWSPSSFRHCARGARTLTSWLSSFFAASTRSMASRWCFQSAPWTCCARAISRAMCGSWKAVSNARPRLPKAQ